MASDYSSEHTLPAADEHIPASDSLEEGTKGTVNNIGNAPEQGLENKSSEVGKRSSEEMDEKIEPLDEVNDGYPTGKQLVPIIGSLILVVFLVSLDMVSNNSIVMLKMH
jgi:hypothetical protein